METEGRYTVRLPGCTPTPLAGYLKGLAVLRLVSEQVDNEARGFWQGYAFHLESRLDGEALIDFVLREYRPTPILAPWNGGSGFYPEDRRAAIEAIGKSPSSRLRDYAQLIRQARLIIRRLGIGAKPAKDRKPRLLTACRNAFPDHALVWLDAAYLLTGGDPKYPPLLGTGGNDGRLEFTNNFMQRLVEVMDPTTAQGEPTEQSAGWLAGSLLGEPVSGLLAGAPIGQFLPGNAGGANAEAGYGGDSLVNPWDFILMMEGALLFATAATRRLGSVERGALSYPFTVHTTGAGYGSAAPEDAATGASRAETWLPVWQRPVRLDELRALLSEGRAVVGRRQARSGVDFAQAVATLGVDRGIGAFERYGYLRRQGRSYLAVPLGRWHVRSQPQVDLLRKLDRWLDELRRVGRDPKVPARFARATKRIEEAILDVCKRGDAGRWQEVIRALGTAEKAMVAGSKTTVERKLSPLPRLSRTWLRAADDGSTEFRLACSLASLQGEAPIGPLRANMVPLDQSKGWPTFDTRSMDDPTVVWAGHDLCTKLSACLTRRCLDALRAGPGALPLSGTRPARLDDIAAFVWGDVHEEKIEELLWGLNAVSWAVEAEVRSSRGDGGLPASYALLKLTHLSVPLPAEVKGAPIDIPYDPAIARRAYSGDLAAATRLAARRLRGSGLTPITGVVNGAPDLSRRIAAALLFPISDADAVQLARAVIRTESAEALV